MGRNLLTHEQELFFIRNQDGLYAREVADLLNKTFGLSLLPKQIKQLRRRMDIDSGLSGVRKGDHTPNAGQFKKGIIPPNHDEVGTTKKDSYGVWRRKVAEPNKWKYMHRIIWEEYNGAIPKGGKVIFLDGNYDNYAIDNLLMVTSAELCYLNKRGMIDNDHPEITRANVNVAKIMLKLSELRKGGTNEN